MSLEKIDTKRLYLFPFTLNIAQEVLSGSNACLTDIGLKAGQYWPDEDMLETLPRIIEKLELVSAPTGFESWMIVEKESMSVIGDAGFKGRPDEQGAVDLGYGIIAAKRKRGYATEAAQGLISWAFTQPEVHIITARCLPENEGSINILTLSGFKNDGLKDGLLHWHRLA